MNIVPDISAFDLAIIFIELALLYTAYRITVFSEIPRVIQSYQGQSYLLAFTTGLTALVRLNNGEPGLAVSFTLFLFILIIVLPSSLGYFIEPILARATVSEMRLSTSEDSHPLANFLKGIKEALFPSKELKLAARRVWLMQKSATHPYARIWFMLLLGLAAWVAFLGIPPSLEEFRPGDRFGLFVSIVLHLVGLYNTIVKDDIISQAIGVLTMDQGLYLAVVKIVAIPVPATFFVVSLYAYTLITIALLFVIVPKLRHEFGSIDLDAVQEQSGLEG